MPHSPMQRRLAVILSADVVGYSRLMERDEAGTMARLQALRHDFFEHEVSRRAGRVFKTMGDGFLVEFNSAVAALEHAVTTQRAIAAAEAARTADDRLVLRIGINIGDVMVEGDDLFGNGVNVAARLQQLAEPGGICIAANVHEQVHNGATVAFASLGSRTVKNLAQPVDAFAVVLDRRGDGHKPVRATHEKPSIAVLRFANLGGDVEQNYFADGMVDEIITGLARIRWLTVIARNSSFAVSGQPAEARTAARALGVRYVLEGSVRKAGQRIRIGAQLIEAETGGHLWAERFEGALSDVFDLQDQITEGVVGAIEPSLRQAEIARAGRKRQADMGAYDIYLRALSHMYEVTREGRLEALRLIDEALAIDPNYAEAHGVAAWCYFARSLWEGGIDLSHREAALRHARAVQSLQTQDATTLAHAAIALAFTTRDYAAALDMIERAIAANVNCVHAYGHGSVINTWAGNYERSIEYAARALRLSPFDPLAVMAHAGCAGAHLMLDACEAGLGAARKALQIYPTHTPSHLIGIVCLVRLGRLDEARAAAKRLLELAPNYSGAVAIPIIERFPEEQRLAGLPG